MLYLVWQTLKMLRYTDLIISVRIFYLFMISSDLTSLPVDQLRETEWLVNKEVELVRKKAVVA
jgi:hypothetical protein